MRIASLHVYPVKSAQGLSVSEARLLNAGVENDRAYMVVSSDTGRFITQRENPKLAQLEIKPCCDPRFDYVLHHEGRTCPAWLPDPTLREPGLYGHFDARGVTGYDCGAAVAEFLYGVLGEGARLVWKGPDFDRSVDATFGGADHQVGYADGFPYLVASLSSLARLNEEMESLGNERLGIDRFRPNIVIEGDMPPFDEDEWQRVAIGGSVFELTKPCARCPIPGLDQKTGERRATGNPMKALNAAGRVGTIAGNQQNGIFFGMNGLLVEAGQGSIAVGDTITVLARHPQPLWTPRAAKP